MQEASQQDGQDEHAGDDDRRNDKGEKVVGWRDDPVEDGITAAPRPIAVLVSRATGRGHGWDVKSARAFLHRVDVNELKQRYLYFEILKPKKFKPNTCFRPILCF